MKMVKSLILGSAAGIVAIAGAQAADLPVKAKPVQYVKICSLYGAGFYYIPGTDTCIKIGGFLRAEMNFQAGGSFNPVRVYNFSDPARDRTTTRVRAAVTFDVRSQTEYGTLRSYVLMAPTDTNSNTVGGGPYASPGTYMNAAFIQFAGFTAGLTASFFDFDLQPYSNQTNIWGSNQGGNGMPVFAYTAQFGSGWSASISAEDPTARRSAILDFVAPGVVGPPAVAAVTTAYGGRRWPDAVANVRIDQAWGSAQVMGALHDTYAVATAPVGGSAKDAVGYAFGAGLKLNAPSLGRGDYFIIQGEWAKGATNYLASNYTGAGVGTAAELLTSGFPGATKRAYGPVFDAVALGAGGLQLTKGWSVTAGYEHVWNPNWKTSLYGAYGKLQYDTAASLAIGAFSPGGSSVVPASPGTNASWSLWQIGSRTVWTPVQNLDLSVEVLYTDLNKSAFNGAACGAGCTYGSKGFVSGMFRAQRNFWP